MYQPYKTVANVSASYLSICPSCLVRCALFRLIGYPPISSYRLPPLYTMHRRGYPSIPLKARFVSSEGTSWSSNPLQHAGEKRTLAQNLNLAASHVPNTLPNDYHTSNTLVFELSLSAGPILSLNPSNLQNTDTPPLCRPYFVKYKYKILMLPPSAGPRLSLSPCGRHLGRPPDLPRRSRWCRRWSWRCWRDLHQGWRSPHCWSSHPTPPYH